MIDLRPVGYLIGLATAALGAVMLLPMGLDLVSGHGNWLAFLQSAAVTFLIGAMLALACANERGAGLTLHDSFLLTTGIWVTLPVFGALPFLLGEPGATALDAWFEAVSGITTTGVTVFTGLDALPMGTNLWRAILQWLGGLGIVIVALIFLPVMRVGGMQFFRSAGFDTLGKILPRARDISTALVRVYALLTLACAAVYLMLGMGAFEALVHALATVSTGGFSSSDRSFGAFGAPEQGAAVLFMLLATLPFIRFVQAMQGSFGPLWTDVQVRAYLRWTLCAVAAVALHHILVRGTAPEAALRDAAFHVVSAFSGTGFFSGELALWAPFPLVILLIVGLIGGCTSSTGCSVKVFRYLILLSAIRAQLRRLHNPNAVVLVRHEGRVVGEDVIASVSVFVAVFFLTFAGLAALLALTGLQAGTAIAAAWTSVANIGLAFGPEVGPTGAVDGFPPAAKLVMIAGMLLGRLELLTVYVLFTGWFWRG